LRWLRALLGVRLLGLRLQLRLSLGVLRVLLGLLGLVLLLPLLLLPPLVLLLLLPPFLLLLKLLRLLLLPPLLLLLWTTILHGVKLLTGSQQRRATWSMSSTCTRLSTCLECVLLVRSYHWLCYVVRRDDELSGQSTVCQPK
jgi:hypothetical protein